LFLLALVPYSFSFSLTHEYIQETLTDPHTRTPNIHTRSRSRVTIATDLSPTTSTPSGTWPRTLR
jgi:hypothetical protein